MAESTSVNNVRPNIRIEIQNNLMDAMEVDEEELQKLSDGEEGEILDEPADFDALIEGITYPSRPTPAEQPKKPWVSVAAKGFSTGIDIFDKEEQTKRTDRAKRFALDPNEIANFTEENLQLLLASLGIDSENEKEVRLEAIHMHGTDEMSSEDVMSYFAKYAPTAIEWINDESCNVVWHDKVSSARALLSLSKQINGMPVEGPTENEKGKSILLKNNNREVELEQDKSMDCEEVSIADIKVPIPPGYWRLGVSHKNSRCILLRFTLKTDKKPFKAEKFSEYYKKHGNPNYGGLKGIISESKKAQFKGIFERNKEIDTKNPWGDLAKTWNRDKRTEEIVVPVPEAPVINNEMKNRLGFKRSHQEVTSGSDDEEKEAKAVEKIKAKSKIPRMRMYADEEEEKIKRKRELDALRKLASANMTQPKAETNDLRNMIRKRDTENVEIVDEESEEESASSEEESAVSEEEEGEIESPALDLSSRLMNRRMKMRIAAEHLEAQREIVISQVQHQQQEPLMTKQHRFREELLRNRNKRVQAPPPPKPHSRNRRQPVKYIASDHEDEETTYSDDDMDIDTTKTNSKVTVVIKKQKQPAVASTVWSRVNVPNNSAIGVPTQNSKDRMQTQGGKRSIKDRLQLSTRDSREGKMRSDNSVKMNTNPTTTSKVESRRNRKVSSSESSSSSSTSSSSSSESSDNENDVVETEDTIKPSFVARPGFRNDLTKLEDHKSPLRIEINNDHYKN